MLSNAAVTIPPNDSDADDLHAELDRLDRELEVLRTRLADDKGALLEAQARCRALRERSVEPEPEPNAGGRRMARTSRLASTRLSSRTAPVVLRAIAGGASRNPALTSAEIATARARAALANDETEEQGGPDAA
ncbi:Hypothetical protein I5071_1940 [Sandaracinus amylolyticus]|nr:Hypothetical protein I5071_1940 [Sandaracinus amylolyticus]